MGENEDSMELTAVDLAGVSVSVGYRHAKGEATHRATSMRLSPQGAFVPWSEPPPNLKRAHLEWSGNPFLPGALRSDCTVTKIHPDGLELVFDQPLPAAMNDWFASLTASLHRRAPDAAVKTSRLYTRATIVSACGLLFGALAIMLPILLGDRAWVDLVAKVLLVLMVASIAGFAWIRGLAGREEVKAIAQSRG